MKKNVLFLIGFMGAGKTTVGKALAKLSKKQFIDLDKYVEQRYEMKIPTIFHTYGEKTFREWERETLEHCAKIENVVIATGGGIVEDEGNISLMKRSGAIVYLKAPFDILYERIKDDTNRPLTKEGKEQLRERFIKREKMYEKATHIVETENKSIQQIVNEISLLLDD